jgi:hypothetical protein
LPHHVGGVAARAAEDHRPSDAMLLDDVRRAPDAAIGELAALLHSHLIGQ